MEYFVYFGLLALFLGLFFVVGNGTSLDENGFKILLFGVVAITVVYLGVNHWISNPPITNVYSGLVVDKKIKTRTETYTCGKSTCTRTVKDYYLISNIRNNEKCEQEVSQWTYNKTKIGTRVGCSKTLPNYMLLDKEKFKATETVLNNFKINFKREDFDLFNYSGIYIDKELKNKNLSALNKNILTNQLRGFLINKPYVVQLFFVKEFDIDVIQKIRNNFLGANPEEVLLYYSINDKGQIEWAKAETHANDDENEYFVATFNSRYLNKEMFSLNTLLSDLDFIDKNYKNIDLYKFEELSKGYNTGKKNWLLIFAVLALGGFLFLFGRLLR